MKEPKQETISVIQAFKLPEGSKARYHSGSQVVNENRTIVMKRRQAHSLRAMGVSEATIRKRGLDEKTLRRTEKRQEKRAAEREETAERVKANHQAVVEAGPLYETVRRQGRSSSTIRRIRFLSYSKALDKVQSERFRQRRIRERLLGPKNDMPF